MKVKWCLFFCVMFASVIVVSASASEHNMTSDNWLTIENDNVECDTVTDMPNDVSLQKSKEVREETTIINKYLQNEEKIQYYAYLKLSEVDEDLQPIILLARKIIIFRYDWVADGITGYVHNKDGTVIEILPQFSDLFPDEWEEPIISTEVDLSYYGK